MKNFAIIVVCLIFGYLIYWILMNYSSVIMGPQHFKYSDCDVSYRQEYVNWNSSSAFAPYNSWLMDSAKSVFIRCLCEKYAVSKENGVRNYIDSLFWEDDWYQGNYHNQFPRLDTVFFSKTSGGNF